MEGQVNNIGKLKPLDFNEIQKLKDLVLIKNCGGLPERDLQELMYLVERFKKFNQFNDL